jgi:hypothetical protein
VGCAEPGELGDCGDESGHGHLAADGAGSVSYYYNTHSVEPAPVVDSHALVYNPDGDAVRDIMRVQKPGDPSSSLLRTVKYAYTPVGQLSSVSKQGVKAGLEESPGPAFPVARDAAGRALLDDPPRRPALGALRAKAELLLGGSDHVLWGSHRQS